MIVSGIIPIASRRSSVNFLPNRAPTASTATCDTEVLQHPQPRLTLRNSPLRPIVSFLLSCRIDVSAHVAQIWNSGCVVENGAGGVLEGSANAEQQHGADSFGALDSSEWVHVPSRPHGFKRKRGKDTEKPSKLSSTRQTARTFACHFYLHNRIGHGDCLNIRLARLSDVRQHLLERAHFQVVHCPVCGTTFPGRPAEARRQRDAHIQSATCEHLPTPPNYPGITEDQDRRIRDIARTTRGNRYSEVQRWYDIWDCLFPGEERPVSPFLTELPDIQRVLDWSSIIFDNDLWRELPHEPWTPLMSPEERRAGMSEFIGSFIVLARNLVGQDAGPSLDDHGLGISARNGTHTSAPSVTTSNAGVISQARFASNHDVDTPLQVFDFDWDPMLPEAPQSGTRNHVELSAGESLSVDSPITLRPLNDSVETTERDAQRHTSSEPLANLPIQSSPPASSVESDGRVSTQSVPSSPSTNTEK